jgi:dTDP-4-amino-4,6-dideoxygalactose transaminase
VTPVPLFDARREFESLQPELEEAALRALRSGSYILGPEVRAFEAEAAAYLGATHAIGCGNGTDALFLALRALGIGPGDGVLTTAYTFFATASAIFAAGATPVLCDIDPGTCNIDTDAARSILEGRSAVHERIGVRPGSIRAVMPVHLFGQPADMGPIVELARAHDLRIVEDAAQAFGALYGEARAGTIGDAGCFSFFPTKNLGGFGDGGMVTTHDPDVAERLSVLRAHGSRRRYEHELLGTNTRLDEVHAAMLRVRLERIDQILDARRAVAATYDAALDGPTVRPVGTLPSVAHTYNLYVVRVLRDRDDLRRALTEVGIATAVYYPRPVHLQPATQHLGYADGDMPQAEEASEQLVALPMFPGIRADEIRAVVDAIGSWEAGR